MTSLREMHSPGVTSSGLFRQQNAWKPSVVSALATLLNERVSLLPAQCCEPAACCLLDFYKSWPNLHLLPTLKLFVLILLERNDATNLKAV